MDESPEPQQQAPSPWPATLLAFSGGALAVVSIRLEHFGADFGACACLLASWLMSRPLSEVDRPDHPLAKRSTRALLVGFAALAGLVGALRLARGG